MEALYPGAGSWAWLLDLEQVCALLVGRSLGMVLVGAPLSPDERCAGTWLTSPLFSNGLECCDTSVIGKQSSWIIQGAHAGLIRSYFRFYIYKAIRKVLFLPFLMGRSYKGLISGS